MMFVGKIVNFFFEKYLFYDFSDKNLIFDTFLLRFIKTLLLYL